MIENKKILLHSAEMAEHANGAAQYLEALLGGRYVTREQTRDIVDFTVFLQEQKGKLKAVLLRPKNKRMLRYIEGNYC
jgi:hypothetical protein